MPRFNSNVPLKSSAKIGRMSKFNSLNKSYFDDSVLESATNKILRIVHPGKSEQNKIKRDKNREKIKNHVLRLTEPVKKADKSKRNNDEFQNLTERIRLIKQRISPQKNSRNTESKAKNLSELAKYENQSTSEVDSERIAENRDSVSPIFMPNIKKRVSFRSHAPEENKRTGYFPKVSDERRTKKPNTRSFHTPMRSKDSSRFSEPPPLINVKRGFVVTDSPGQLVLEQEQSKIKVEEGNISKEKTNPGNPSTNVSTLDCSAFDFETVLKTPERTDEPYDLLGLTRHSDENPSASFSMF